MDQLIQPFLKLYFRRLFAYRERDSWIGQLMEQTLRDNSGQIPDKNRTSVLEGILSYRTRLYEAATVQTLTIWGAARGFEDAVHSDQATQLAITMRLAFGEGDIIDTNNDEFDPEIIKAQPNAENAESRLNAHKLYDMMISYLDDIVFRRFDTLHRDSAATYSRYRRMLEGGQREDIDLHVSMLRNDYDSIRKRYQDQHEIMELLVRKLGWMGEAAAKIAYLESGGTMPELEETLARFYRTAAVLIQFWGNDVHKIWVDLEKLDTNPLITLAITKGWGSASLSEGVKSTLRQDASILDRMVQPYEAEMSESLAKLRQLGFDPRTHQALALQVRRLRTKEKASLMDALK